MHFINLFAIMCHPVFVNSGIWYLFYAKRGVFVVKKNDMKLALTRESQPVRAVIFLFYQSLTLDEEEEGSKANLFAVLTVMRLICSSSSAVTDTGPNISQFMGLEIR